MISTFKETIRSLQDQYYGNEIIARPLRSVIWYWSKYLLLLAGIVTLLSVAFMTNLLPQAPRFIEEKFPSGYIQLKDHLLTTSLPQPIVIGNKEFALIMDTENSTASELEAYVSGISFHKDQVFLKSEDGRIESQSYSQVPDFYADKNPVIDFLSHNMVKVWFVLLGLILILVLIGTSITWSWKMLSYVIWSAVFFLIVKFIMKKTLNYLQVFRIVIYAGVLPFLFSTLLSFFPSPILEILNLAIFSYLGFNWVTNLKTPAPLEPVYEPVSLPEAPVTHKRKTRKTKRT